MKRFALCLLAVTVIAARAQQPSASAVEEAFQAFWAANSPNEATQRAGAILKTGVTFEEALRRLKAGHTYSAQDSGVVILSNTTSDGIEHNYAVNVPKSYDPAKRWQVRFQLHGGIGGRNNNQKRGNGEIGQLAGAEQFYVLPYAWNDAPWWGADQLLNLDAIVDSLKRTYDIDENRIVLSGVSDGGTGAYYVAARDTTPFASFLPLNGFYMVLANSRIEDGHMFLNNLRNKPFFVVNGGEDPLYPTSEVEPYTNHLVDGGVKIDYHPQPDGQHNTRWWPDVVDSYEQFVKDHPRDPNPATLTWETNDLSRNRAHWLVIDELGAAPGEAPELSDLNYWSAEGPGSLFRRALNPGRVDLVRKGNTVEATTKGVSAFTLLLSPDKFDLSQPVKVVANGREVFNAKVRPSLDTLLKWAARDNDRTMLYAAEVKIKLSH
jgi:hypothetical protein